jgi:hypothetical protein
MTGPRLQRFARPLRIRRGSAGVLDGRSMTRMNIVWLEPWAPIERPEQRQAVQAEPRLNYARHISSTDHPLWLSRGAMIRMTSCSNLPTAGLRRCT